MMSLARIYLLSLGCPKNLVDSEVMAASLLAAGMEITAEVRKAQIILINTCSFITPAKEESLEEILSLARCKDPSHGSCRLLVVAGCLPQRYGKELSSLLPEVDLFLGTGEVADAGRLIREQWDQKTVPSRVVLSSPSFLMDSRMPRYRTDARPFAYLKIADGCSNHCSYCVIPQIRGPLRSRPAEDILREARGLLAQGVRELILVAQDTTAYGQDRPEKPSLASLLAQLVQLEGLCWLRVLYTYPGGLDEETLNLIAREDKICKYLDLPIQHIDDGILGAMKRRAGAETIIRQIKQARHLVPQVALRTSLIVGFPGEGKKEFQQLLAFVKATGFDHLGVFTYSPEEDTPAVSLPRQVSSRVKEKRRQAVLEAQALISHEINQALIGTRHWFLVEGKNDDGDYPYWGRIARQAPDIDGITYLAGSGLAFGDLVECIIVDADEYDLFARAGGND
jgi:ribosomal protein S12 methylthiotransferase